MRAHTHTHTFVPVIILFDYYARSAHGYTYSVPFNSSYNPVSRQDSERQSISSAGKTSDSEVNSK